MPALAPRDRGCLRVLQARLLELLGQPEGKPAAWSKKVPGAFPLGQDPHLEFQLCAKWGGSLNS